MLVQYFLVCMNFAKTFICLTFFIRNSEYLSALYHIHFVLLVCFIN